MLLGELLMRAPIDGIKPKLNACDRETLERAAFVVKPVERFAAPFSWPCRGSGGSVGMR